MDAMLEPDMNEKNILITGIPRSGTTLICNLLNKIENTVALHEPLPVFEYAKEATIEGIYTRIDDFFLKSRASLMADGSGFSRHVKGIVPDNPFDNSFAPNGLRKSIQDPVAKVKFPKKLEYNMNIAVKHTAAFAALLAPLSLRYRCYAMVRNPLSVLMSWQTVDIPINRGRIPAAEIFSPVLKSLLDDEQDVLKRQIIIIHWLCDQFIRHLGPQQIIRYETLIDSKGACLSHIVPEADGFREPLCSKNINPLYPRNDFRRIGEALLNSDGAVWQLYNRQQVVDLFSSAATHHAERRTGRPPHSQDSSPDLECAPAFKVNFLIIGAQKAGTTALAKFLGQHPEICMARKKEVHFFNSPNYPAGASPEKIASLYHVSFPPLEGRTVVGEATPAYLFLPFVPERVHAYNPAMKLICLLREPGDRAWSQYCMEKTRGAEKRNFWWSIIREKLQYRKQKDDYRSLNSNSDRRFCYLERGLYSRQISRWLDYFPADQMLFICMDDMRENHEATLNRAYEFLGVIDKNFIPEREIVFSLSGANHSPGIITRGLLHLYFNREKVQTSQMVNIPGNGD